MAMQMHITEAEMRLIQRLRERNPAEHIPSHESARVGEHMADILTRALGSWRFILLQSLLLILWIALNIAAWVEHWDPYPFILLNLVLSFQAAYTAPVILMSQNREAQID